MEKLFRVLLFACLAVIGSMLALAQAGPALAAIKTGYYKLPATVDTEVNPALATELWAQVWRPSGSGPFPLIVMLHGNHSTCGHFDAMLGIRVDDDSSYTTTGTCPMGYVVAPSHLGYAYLATDLAARGYLVVSINANRGINAAFGPGDDFGLNLARGRLVLRHLQKLARWNAGVGQPPGTLGFGLKNIISFNHVGLMGHSRGGEGMRAAVVQYRDPGSPWPARIGKVTFEGLFEIGPVDGQSNRVLNAKGLPWNVLLPGCDGDVSDLEGVKPFDRMMLIGNEAKALNKSDLEVFGANHNFYNTEWQASDAPGCSGQTALFPQYVGSASQRTTARIPMRRFFQAHVGGSKQPALAHMFDPSYPLPAVLTGVTLYTRGFTPTPRTPQNYIVDDFENATGTSSHGIANSWSGLNAYTHGFAGFSHDNAQRAAFVDWTTPAGFLQLNAATSGSPADISGYKSLEFRVTPLCSGGMCATPSNPAGDLNFSVGLANGDGTFSTFKSVKAYAALRRPVGSFANNEILQTVRIPLSAFTGAKLKKFKGVRFRFDKTPSASIYLANVRLDRAAAGPGGLAPANVGGQMISAAAQQVAEKGTVNRIVVTRQVRVQGQQAVEIEFSSDVAFPVTDSLPVLRIGGHSFRWSRFASPDQRRMVFILSPQEYAAVGDGDAAELQFGAIGVWKFGAYRKP